MKFPWNRNGQDGSVRNRSERNRSLLSGFRKKAPRPYKDVSSDFGEAQDIHQIWDLSEKDAYVRQHGKRRIPRFVLPVIIFVFLGVLLFWLLPGVVSRYFSTTQDTPQEQTVPIKMYSGSTRVVDVYAANLFSQPDIKSDRITQVLYNEPVTLLDTAGTAEFIHIETKDGVKGYIKSSEVTADTDSVEPNMHLYKLLVSDVSKNVMSHASNGTLLIQVMMNTVLYADGKSEGVYQVTLPTGEKGWISSSGVIELGVLDPAEKVGVRYFVSSILSFVNVTQLDHGITMRGLSVEGLAYISAEVNGVDLPRTMSEQAATGERVDLTYDKVTGLLDVSSISPGDLVFFRDPDDATSAAPYEMGICTGTGSIIMSSSSRTTLRLVTLSDSQQLENRIIAVRRIFS
jgi:hypothetical protein